MKWGKSVEWNLKFGHKYDSQFSYSFLYLFIKVKSVRLPISVIILTTNRKGKESCQNKTAYYVINVLDLTSCSYSGPFSKKIWQIGEIFDVGPLEGPYIPESQGCWHPELNCRLVLAWYGSYPDCRSPLKHNFTTTRKNDRSALPKNYVQNDTFKLSQ